MFLVIVIIIAVIIYFVVKENNKKKANLNQSPSKSNNRQSSSPGNHQLLNLYHPETIQRAGIQVLESANIIATSKALDTVQGRYTFLLQVLDTLKTGQNNPRYVSDIQRSIDAYKGMYYDRIPTQEELAILIKPKEFNTTDFYCNSLLRSFKEAYQDQLLQMDALKRDDAKARRKEKLYQLLLTTKDEVKVKCSQAISYQMVIEELEKVESELRPQLSQTFLQQSNEYSGKFEKKKIKEGEFVLNPGGNLELTVINADIDLGKQVKGILDDENIWDSKKIEILTGLFAQYNLRVKEVESYKKKYGKLYHDKIENLKNTSEEWKDSMEKDREDLLEDFREEALSGIYERANCDLHTLFEKEPVDITFDDELIKDYGFENFRTYLKFADNLEKVRVLPNDNYNRPRFDKLVELGIAIKGQDIPLEEILGAMTLKDLNEVAKHPDKEFKRKNQAIEFIMTLPDIKERLGSKISFRELFKLKPLPEKYSSINLKELADAWSFTNEVVSLLVDTYRNSKRAEEDLRDKEYVKGYTVGNFFGGEQICPYAKELCKKSFSKSKPPKIPYHVGCNCHIEKEYNF